VEQNNCIVTFPTQKLLRESVTLFSYMNN